MEREFLNTTVKQQRNSSFELLRIFSMLCIIAHHFYVHGGMSGLTTGNRFLMSLFDFGGKFGVILFMLISGYFMVEAKFKVTKLVKLLTQTLFYSIIIYFIFVGIGKEKLSWGGAKLSLFPTTFKLYWFSTNYIIVYCLAPFVNVMLNGLNKKQFLLLLGTGFLIYLHLKHSSGVHVNNVALFYLLYFLGAYLKKFPVIQAVKVWVLSVIAVCLYIAIILLQWYGKMNYFNTDSYLLILLSAIVMLLFERIKFTSKAVNLIASTTYGVYLIHDNLYIRGVLWTQILKTPSWVSNPWLFLYGAFAVFVVFVVCGIIDLLRQLIIEKPFTLLCNKIKMQLKASWQKNEK